MPKIVAVVGANFGDEGKGLLVDALAAGRPRALVIRYNGGAQAAHTVVTPSGHRHVFSHFGSGTLAGADTYLSEFFIVNPFSWKEEWSEVTPTTTWLHTSALLTTPYDMLLNQWAEKARGANRHGSCGFGISETVVRCRGHIDDVHTFASDLQHVPRLTILLREIREHYVPHRAEVLGIILSKKQQRIIASDQLLADYIEACRAVTSTARFVSGDAISKVGYNDVIFEGAQGLLLDQDHPLYGPKWVTHSKTGVHNIKSILATMRWSDPQLIFVTRAYLTRHGEGPFPTEDLSLHYVDSTNKPNEFQGALRFGHLHIPSLIARIMAEASLLGVRPSLAVTCLDQMSDGKEIMTVIGEHGDFTALYGSTGPTRNTLHPVHGRSIVSAA